MLTSFADDEALFDAIMAGASGYVLKQVRGADILGAVRTVAAGGSLLDPRTTAAGDASGCATRPTATDPLAGLTEQERQILELIGEGLTNRQIGERMFLAEKTVKNYVSQPARQARHGAAHPGRRVRRPPRRARAREDTPFNDRAGPGWVCGTSAVNVPPRSRARRARLSSPERRPSAGRPTPLSATTQRRLSAASADTSTVTGSRLCMPRHVGQRLAQHREQLLADVCRHERVDRPVEADLCVERQRLTSRPRRLATRPVAVPRRRAAQVTARRRSTYGSL